MSSDNEFYVSGDFYFPREAWRRVTFHVQNGQLIATKVWELDEEKQPRPLPLNEPLWMDNIVLNAVDYPGPSSA